VQMLAIAMPKIDLSNIRAAPMPPRRVNTPPPAAAKSGG